LLKIAITFNLKCELNERYDLIWRESLLLFESYSISVEVWFTYYSAATCPGRGTPIYRRAGMLVENFENDL
jgi:hypothetical protein